MIFLSSVVLNRAVADGMMLLTTCALVIFTVKISCITIIGHLGICHDLMVIHQSLIPSTEVIQLPLTLKKTTGCQNFSHC